MGDTHFDSSTRLGAGARYNYTRTQGALTDTFQDIFENDSGGVCIVEGGVITERAGSTGSFTMRLVKEGDVEGASNDLFHAVPLVANEAFSLPFPLVVLDGDKLTAKAAATNSLNYYLAIRREI